MRRDAVPVRRARRIACSSIITALLAVSCGGPVAESPVSSSSSRSTTSVPGETTTAAPAHQAPDLTKRRLVWFAPLPPQRGGPYDGSDDWSQLWGQDADWEDLAGRLDIYKLYGGWVAAESSNAEIERVRTTLDGFGLGLAVETGPLFPTEECGRDVEGFAGEQARDTVGNVMKGGGTIDLIALDEPWYYAHLYDGPGACHWSLEQIAAGVAEFARIVRETFPDVQIGDIEPLPEPVTAQGLGEWIDAWIAAVGEPPAFLHLDPNYGRPGWPELIAAIGEEAHARDVPYGVIVFGEPYDTTDLDWLQHGGSRLNRLREVAGVEPDHLVFQSWQDRPDRALPESDPTTYTGWLLAYLTDPTSVMAVGPPNWAVSATITASSEIEGFPATNIADGSGAHWNAAEAAPGWVELALAAPSTIVRFDLLVAQDPAGSSVHELWVARAGGVLELVHVFEGVTGEGDLLSWGPDEPLQEVEVVRVLTTGLDGGLAPAWHEIELIGPS